jgi:hypothetical protein
MQLAPKTTLRMPKPDAGMIQPLSGRMIARVDTHGRVDELRVRLPPGTLVLRAGANGQAVVEAAVNISEEMSSVEMLTGSAAIAVDAGVDIPIAPRRWASFRPDGTLLDTGASGPTTSLLAPTEGAVILTAGSVDLTWTPLDDADHYTVLLTTGDVTRKIDAPKPNLVTRVVTGGYEWTVRGWRGQDAWPLAPSRTFRVDVDDRPPPLVIDSPTDSATVEGPRVRFTGHSEPGAVIEIGAARTSADARGQFALEVTISRGLSNVVVKARDPLGNTTRASRRVLWQ